MPLIKSKSKAAVGENIKREESAGRPRAQAVAIALNTQRAAGGGSPPPAKDPPMGGAADHARMLHEKAKKMAAPIHERSKMKDDDSGY